MNTFDVSLDPGHYVVAVSGGVDSVALLHALQGLPGVSLTVAHFDHGIREDSDLDQQLVAEHAHRFGLPYVFDRGALGAGVSEAAARKARYEFLHSIREATGAQAIITAHHQDDVLETAVLNIIRGTGRKGLSSLRDRPLLRRPLLHVPKAVLKAYAKDQGLTWREDSTNSDTTLTRNYIRHVLLPRLTDADKKRLLAYVRHVGALNRMIDQGLSTLLHVQPSKQSIDRASFIALPHVVAKEFLAEWLRAHEIRDFDAKTIERLVTAIKTAKPGSRADIMNMYFLTIGKKEVRLEARAR